MTKRVVKNPYPGINLHLNSTLQQRGGKWKSFHTTHLGQLFDTLDEILPESYYAIQEDSLQIATYDAQEETIADILILRDAQPITAAMPQPDTSTPTLTLTMPLDDEEETLSAILIYQDDTPVTRIELLSPANKPGGSHHYTYLDKRRDTLYGGLRLLEIDYLHERRPIIAGIPSYPNRHKAAYPFYILVNDPRSESVQTDVYGWHILDALPVINIPLEGQEAVRVDFGEIYRQTTDRRPFHRGLDYSQLPANFGAYTPEDQERIRAYMAEMAAEKNQ